MKTFYEFLSDLALRFRLAETSTSASIRPSTISFSMTSWGGCQHRPRSIVMAWNGCGDSIGSAISPRACEMRVTVTNGKCGEDP